MRFSAGQELEGLEFLEVLSSSDRSIAYKVRDTISRRLEYLKLVPRSVREDKESLERFMREARIHASLEHPNIARFYSSRHIDGELVLTREWIEGETLASRFAKEPLQLPQAIDYLGQALSALQYAHGRGVAHRNVTPRKIMITRQGVVKLTGFDLARGCTDPRLTRTGVTLGSVHYMAPELVNGTGQANERTDLYAAGVILYETITARKPFDGNNQFDIMLAHVESDAEPPSRLNPDVSPELEQVVGRALQKNPDLRYQTADEFRQDLMRMAESLRLKAFGEEPSTTPPSPSVGSPGPRPPAPISDKDEEAPATHLMAPPAQPPLPVIVPDSVQPLTADRATTGLPDTVKLLGLGLLGFSIGLLVFLSCVLWLD